MTRRRVVAALAVVAGGLVIWLVAPAVTSTGPREDLPPAYAGRANPRAGEADTVAVGAALFKDECTSCHGPDADGRGPAATGLTPPPANLRGGDTLLRHSDAYLYYRLSEGKPGTAMPSFRGALDEAERWALVAYLRSLHPDDGRR